MFTFQLHEPVKFTRRECGSGGKTSLVGTAKVAPMPVKFLWQMY